MVGNPLNVSVRSDRWRIAAPPALAIENSAARIRAFDTEALEHPRRIGKQQLPTTLGGLLVHVADHTQRHVGQAITTAKVALSGRKQA